MIPAPSTVSPKASTPPPFGGCALKSGEYEAHAPSMIPAPSTVSPKASTPPPAQVSMHLWELRAGALHSGRNVLAIGVLRERRHLLLKQLMQRLLLRPGQAGGDLDQPLDDVIRVPVP